MKKGRIIFFTILIFIFINIPTKLYAEDLMFHNITTEDGLSQNTIHALFQDSDGYIWIGTSDGLNKYNGFEFYLYNKMIGNNHNIVGSTIRCLNEDLNKNLWVGTSEGLSSINLNNNIVKNYTTNNSNLSLNTVRDIKITNRGNVIIATPNGLSIYDENVDNFIFLADSTVYDKFQNILSIEICDENIYVLTTNLLFKYDLNSKEYTPINNETINSLLASDTFTTMTLFEKKLYLGTYSNGVYVYNIQNNLIEKQYKFSAGENLKVQSINVNQKQVIIGTNNGLYIYNESDNVSKYTRDIYNKYSLTNNDIRYIMNDSSGLLWIGTFYGISTADCTGTSQYIHPIHALDHNVIFGVYEDSDNNIWMGVNRFGISIFNSNTKKMSYINTTTSNKLSNNNVRDLKGNEKYIFAATEQGLNIIDRKTLEIKVLSDELDDPFCYTLYLDNDNLWVGTIDGFNIIDLKDFSVKSLAPLLNANNITVRLGGPVFKDSQNIYWLGCMKDSGLLRFDSLDNSLQLFKHNEFKNSISDDTILSINEDEQGNLWFGTESGLNKFDRKTNTFKVYSYVDGLSNNTIYSIIPYENNKLWVSTNGGINYLTFEDDEIVKNIVYLKGVEFNSNSYLKNEKGEILFGGVNGLYILNPQLIYSNTYVPQLKFDSFKVNGLNVENLNHSTISYKDNYISIKLFSTIFEHSNHMKFYYRINKLSDKWIPIDGNEVTFSNLASGTYDIDFKVSNFNDKESHIKTLSFKVKPPFWKTNFAKLVYFIIILILIIYLWLKIKYMNDAIIIRDSQLGREIQIKNSLLKKNIELEKRKNNYLINMSHELRTPLNVLLSIQQLLTHLNKEGPIAQDKLNKYINMSNNNLNRLLKIINDLIDNTKMDEGHFKLHLETKDIIYVIEDATLSLRNLAEEKNINLIFDTTLEECIMKFDSDAIATCIINLVGNAIKFTEPYGEILVNVADLCNLIRIDINDNGCGIDSKDIGGIFDRFSQVLNPQREAAHGSGLGLTITKKIVELHNGEIFVSSVLGQGSTFTIILPKNT